MFKEYTNNYEVLAQKNLTYTKNFLTKSTSVCKLNFPKHDWTGTHHLYKRDQGFLKVNICKKENC